MTSWARAPESQVRPQLRGMVEETTRRSRPEDNVIAVGVGVTMGASVQIGTKSIQLLAKPSDEYDARRLAKGNPKGGKGGKINGFEEEEGAGMNELKALDEDQVFADSALDGWDLEEGDFYALSLVEAQPRSRWSIVDARGSARFPKQVAEKIIGSSQYFPGEFGEYSSDDECADGLDSEASDSDDLRELISDITIEPAITSSPTLPMYTTMSSTTSTTSTSPMRSRAREHANDPWHGGTSPDPWSSKGSTGSTGQMSPQEFQQKYAHLKAVAQAWSPPPAAQTAGREITTELTTSHLVPGAPISWSAPHAHLADAPESLAVSTADHNDSTHSVGLSVGCARILTMAANPLQDEHGSKAEGVEPKPSFGTYEESDSSGPRPLRSSSSSEAEPGRAGSEDSEVEFLERLRVLQLDVHRKRLRKVKKKRSVARPPGLAQRDNPPALAPALTRGTSAPPMASCGVSSASNFGRRKGRQQFSQRASARDRHDDCHDHAAELRSHASTQTIVDVHHVAVQTSGAGSAGSVGSWTSETSGDIIASSPCADGPDDIECFSFVDSSGDEVWTGVVHGLIDSEGEDDVEPDSDTGLGCSWTDDYFNLTLRAQDPFFDFQAMEVSSCPRTRRSSSRGTSGRWKSSEAR